MPYAAGINNFYWDFGNGYVPFFAVIGAYNIYMYGDNPVQNAINTVPAAIASFDEMGVLNPIGNQSMYYGDVDTFDISELFGHPNGEPITVTIDNNSNPDVVSAVINDDILTLTAQNVSGTSTISLLGVGGTLSCLYEFDVIVSNPTDQYVLILDLDTTSNASVLQSSIENFYSMGDVHIVNDVTTFPFDNADAIFVLLGIYANNYVLTAAEAAPLAAYLDNGGNVYMEGGDTWYYDTQTVVHPYFNINAIADGASDLSAVTGHDFLNGFSWTYTGENAWIDRIAPIAPAVTLFSNPTVGYDCGVAYDSGTYKTIGASFEITGLGGTNTLNEAVSGIIDFFGIGGTAPTFDPPTNLAVVSNPNENFATFTWDAPASPVYWLDDMDSYTAGQYLALQSPDWTTWSGTPGGTEDGYVVDENSYSGANSVKVQGTTTDLVHEFGTFTSGIYDVSMMMYIEPGYGGYYNLLHFFNGTSSEWGLEVYFGSTGNGYIHAAMMNAATFTHPTGAWFEVKCVIDLDADWAEYYVDGTFVHEWQWSVDTTGAPGSCEFGAIDVYAAAPSGDTVMFYFDDVMMTSAAVNRELTGYNVYLDSELQGDTTDTQWIFEDLTNGQTYTAGVEAVYDDGVSELVEIDFEFMGVNAGNDIITKTELSNNYPNPFNPTTTIAFSLADAGHVTLEVYNVRGEKVKTLFDDILEPAHHKFTWNGTNESGKTVASGVYFYKMKAGNYQSTRKMILMK